MLPAQRQFVLAHVDRSLFTAFPTFHINAPPEITATSLTTSPSLRISSSRIISPARVAITDSGTMLHFCNAESKFIPGFTSYSLSRRINLTNFTPVRVILPSRLLTANPSTLYDCSMKIGMMADTYKPYVSGITSYIDLNKRALEKAGHEVYVFTFGDLDYKDDEPRVIRNPGLPLADTGFYLSLRYKTAAKKLLQTMDVVHVHHPFLSGRLAISYCRPAQIPVVFTNHTRYDLYAQARLPLMPEEVSHSLLQAYMPDFCEEMDLVISPSRGMEKILRQYGVESHIEVVPNGADLTSFHEAKPLARAEFGYKDDDILLVYAGRIAPEKNLRFLIQAFAGVSQIIPNAYLLIIGSGQKEHVEEVKPVPNEFGVQDRVRFTGLVPYHQLPSYLAMCDIFVTASVTEVHPFSVIEAMGTGLPIMGIDSPGVGDSVTDGETGLLATEAIASFTAKLTYLCLNRDLQKKFGAAARKASEQFSIERTTRIMLKHYTRLTQNTKPIKRKLDERLMEILEEFLK
ncbi:MAG: glycosyltransferase family 4 protein [Anaerolineae bacterium]|nr:glycosyltransferase family 4 protein [Anaerolineae bacterium]